MALCRKLCCKSAQNYTPVNHHGLDEEEIAFKNSLETQNGEGDDIDELFNFSGQDELEFDTNDLDNLEMLQVRSTVSVQLTEKKQMLFGVCACALSLREKTFRSMLSAF